MLSDSWPLLREVYKKYKLDKYFVSMIISSELGISKPNKEMYKEELRKLGLKEDEVIFIDDNPKNCDGSNMSGIESIVLNRVLVRRIYSRFILRTKHKVERNLHELKEITYCQW
ncbi:HAD-IA family hydrolase [Clostridium paraputrificum]|uniref:HAD-IA family hydrolase n=1 Tax=Clostridium paraputrificum TaxID=29363 RepID=UPI003D33A64F